MFYMCPFNEKYLLKNINSDSSKDDLLKAMHEFDQGNFVEGHAIFDKLASANNGNAILVSAMFSKDGEDEQSFENSKNSLDFLTQQFDAPILLAADVRERPYPANRNIFQDGISLDVQRKLTFCSSNDPRSSKKVFISLINSVINKLP